jgi:hypothetical protein
MKCDRCHTESPRFTKMSFFNMDTICPECEEIEKAHPDYELARKVEREACLNGNMNYPGIGLPKDLEFNINGNPLDGFINL